MEILDFLIIKMSRQIFQRRPSSSCHYKMDVGLNVYVASQVKIKITKTDCSILNFKYLIFMMDHPEDFLWVWSLRDVCNSLFCAWKSLFLDSSKNFTKTFKDFIHLSNPWYEKPEPWAPWDRPGHLKVRKYHFWEALECSRQIFSQFC